MPTLTIDAEYAAVRSAALLYRPAGRGAETGTDRLTDILDILNSRGLPPGHETALAVVEERAYLKLQATIDLEEIEPVAGVDYAPEATARRIVDFATGFLDRFAESRGGLDEEVLDEFMDLIEGAIDEGFAQARAILEGFAGGDLPDDVDGTIGRTRDLVTEYLEEFRARTLERLLGTATEEEVQA
jgi:hypothetical protein